ncbi:hypothetical protein CSQ96_09540 [Janthinobacterium sp. BJB412]|nr:hypothetical protein CSQ96_09540 [Janthinobacterium sp. BJB412]
MPTENLVLRTVYVDPDIDDQLREEALAKQLSKADLFRTYLLAGIKAVKLQPNLFKVEGSRNGPALVLRTVHMDPKLDEKLRVEAFDSRTSKNDLMRRYVRIGMNQQDASTTRAVRPSKRSANKREPVLG